MKLRIKSFPQNQFLTSYLLSLSGPLVASQQSRLSLHDHFNLVTSCQFSTHHHRFPISLSSFVTRCHFSSHEVIFRHTMSFFSQSNMDRFFIFFIADLFFSCNINPSLFSLNVHGCCGRLKYYLTPLTTTQKELVPDTWNNAQKVLEVGQLE